MSYQLELQKNPDAKPNIAMPPLPEEPVVQAVPDNQVESLQHMIANQPEEVNEVSQEIQEEYVQPVQQEESFQAKNFRQLRQEAERIKQENASMAKRLAEYESMQQKPRYELPKNQEVEDEQIDDSYNPGDLVEVKHLQKYNKKIQNLEQQIYQQQQQNAASLAQAQLRAKYPDFDKVVNQENIEQLNYAYPELANTLNASADLYSKAVSAYTVIKNLGIVPKGDDYMAQKTQAQKNAAKPRPLASVNPQQGDSPLSKANAFANGLTDDLKTQLLKEMYAARRDH